MNPTPIRFSTATIHQEENTDYYEGTGESEITRNGGTPGEGWVWEYYYPGTSLSHTFMLDSIDAVQGTSMLRLRLYGTTLHSVTPDHQAQIWVNDSLAGEIGFDGRAGVVFASPIPTSWLVTGANRVRIVSLPTANSINQFYLDWFEVGLPAKAPCGRWPPHVHTWPRKFPGFSLRAAGAGYYGRRHFHGPPSWRSRGERGLPFGIHRDIR